MNGRLQHIVVMLVLGLCLAMAWPPRDKSRDRPTGYFEPCTTDDECASGLRCLQHAGGCSDVPERVCTRVCQATAECPSVTTEPQGCGGCGDQAVCGTVTDAGVDIDHEPKWGFGICGFRCCG
ncbi:MAG: hypothetical protein HY904_14850 [Deltaproteobacteria bacterium]|nr:hypothetical protein [Deltaproteobacteria bacterium]